MATSSGGGTAAGNGNRAEDSRSPALLNGSGNSRALSSGQQQEFLSAAEAAAAAAAPSSSSSAWPDNYQGPAQSGSTNLGGIGVGGGYRAAPSLGYMNAGSIEGRSSTPSNALMGISTESIDPNEGNISIMPPPSLFSYQTPTPAGMDTQPESGSSNNPSNASDQQAYPTVNQHHTHQQHQQYSHLQPPGLHPSAYPQASGQDDTKPYPSAASSTNNSSNNNNHYTAQGNMGISSSSVAEDGSSYQADWLALPLDPLLNSHGAGVTQTSLMGPDVGGFDLLEVLLEEEIGQSMGVVY